MIKIFCLIILSIFYSCGKSVKNNTPPTSVPSTCHPPIDINNFTKSKEINNFKFEDNLYYIDYNSMGNYYSDDYNYYEESQDNSDVTSPCEFNYEDNYEDDVYPLKMEDCIDN